MKLERIGGNLEARLSVRGAGRFFGAAFLSFWLAGWAVGETVVLWILGKGAWALLTGTPPGSDDRPMHPGAAMGVGLFLLFWVSLWTFGGIAAARELLRLLFGRDVLVAGPDGLEVKRSYGLFRSAKRWPRGDIRRFYRRSAGAALHVETTRGTEAVTQLGTADERAELERVLNQEFSVQEQAAPASALPHEWCEVLSPEHETVLVKDPAVRRKQARTAWIVCAGLSVIPLYLLLKDQDRRDLPAAVFFFSLLAGIVGWGAMWLSFGRSEWRLDQGRMVLQRRFWGNRKERFEAATLELVEDNSGDGEPSYSLVAVAAGAPARASSSWSAVKGRRTIYSRSGDATEPRKFGLWLKERCQMPLADLTTAEAKAMDLEALKQQLAESGRVGRAALRLMERFAPEAAKGRRDTP